MMLIGKCRLVVLLCIGMLCWPARSQPIRNTDQSQKSLFGIGKPVLLVFSGSDWCQPCKRIDRQIFDDSSYAQFERQHLQRITIDFPQRRKQSPELKARNDSMAAIYNPRGIFPLLLLLDSAFHPLATLPYDHYNPGRFIQNIKHILQMHNLLKEYSRQSRHMGSAFEFIIAAASEQQAETWLNQADAEMHRIEVLLTEFSEHSDTAHINRQAGRAPVTVADETYQLLKRCMQISGITGGAFDITAARLKKLYRFQQQESPLPSPSERARALRQCGYRHLKLLPNNQVFAEIAGMHLNFAAIGKGYAADRVKEMLQQQGVSAGVINASGDISCWGLRPGGRHWKAGIASPQQPHKRLLWLTLNQQALATSGNYIQYFRKNNQRFSHNIDPRTAVPVTGIASVSIISPSAELSDALATAVSVLGHSKGLALVNQLPHTHAIIIDENNQIYHSSQVQLENDAVFTG